MRAFKFRLERILSLRRHEEEARMLEFGRITGECRRLQLAITDRVETRSAALSGLSNYESSDVAYRLAVESYAHRLEVEAESLSEELSRREIERRDAEHRYRVAKQNVDALERLQERKQNAHKHEQLKLEGKSMDDVAQQIFRSRSEHSEVARA